MDEHAFPPTGFLWLVSAVRYKRFISFWKKSLSGEEGKGKLRTYKLFKQHFGLEPYLENILDKDLRRCLSSFRISAHRLRIERGRYCREKPEKRLCDSCNVVENEVHFLCECSKYDTQRQILFDNMNSSDIALGTDNESIFIRIMTSSDRDINKFIATFIHDCGIT